MKLIAMDLLYRQTKMKVHTGYQFPKELYDSNDVYYKVWNQVFFKLMTELKENL